MIGSLGPVITLLLAWLLLGESLGALQLLGAALVIYGVRIVATASPAEASGPPRLQPIVLTDAPVGASVRCQGSESWRAK